MKTYLILPILAVICLVFTCSLCESKEAPKVLIRTRFVKLDNSESTLAAIPEFKRVLNATEPILLENSHCEELESKLNKENQDFQILGSPVVFLESKSSGSVLVEDSTQSRLMLTAIYKPIFQRDGFIELKTHFITEKNPQDRIDSLQEEEQSESEFNLLLKSESTLLINLPKPSGENSFIAVIDVGIPEQIPENEKWWDRIKVGGDIAVTGETVKNLPYSNWNVEGSRIRSRITIEGDLNP